MWLKVQNTYLAVMNESIVYWEILKLLHYFMFQFIFLAFVLFAALQLYFLELCWQLAVAPFKLSYRGSYLALIQPLHALCQFAIMIHIFCI